MNDHKLVDSGPYAIVRHPSYTGMYLTAISIFMTTWSRGSWVRECGVLGWGRYADVFLWVLVVGLGPGQWAYSMVSLLKRGPIEDAQLKKQFGEVWVQYSQRVRYRLVPGIY